MAAAAAASILSPPLTVSAQQALQEAEGATLGLRGGSFLLLPSLELRGGYTDNIARAAGSRKAGSVVEIEPALSIRSNWSRHALGVDLRGRHTAYDGNFEQLEGFLDADVSGRLDIYSRTSLTLRAGYGLTEDGGAVDHSVSAGTELAHRFNRLAVSLRGGYERFDFDEDRTGVSSTVDTNVSDYSERNAGLRVSYDVSPLTSLFAEADVNRRDHRQPMDINGFLRGSEGYSAVVGLRMSNGSKLSGELSAGYRLQKPDDPALVDVEGVSIDAGLEWQASALTRLSLDARTRLGETTLAGSAGYVSRSAGFEIDHRMGRNIVLNAGLTYTRNEFAGTDLIEQTYDAGVGLDYLLNRYMTLSADADHLRFASTNPGEDYIANTVMLGFKVQR
jgi:hypothetical protein